MQTQESFIQAIMDAPLDRDIQLVYADWLEEHRGNQNTIKALRSGTVIKEQATVCRNFEHVKLKNRDGTPVRCRVNGRCKTWKTRPGDFRLPTCYGLRGYFAITPSNAHEWVAVS